MKFRRPFLFAHVVQASQWVAGRLLSREWLGNRLTMLIRGRGERADMNRPEVLAHPYMVSLIDRNKNTREYV